ncbi:winged helix DNA-binding protein [Sphingomonas morindae]|uniref:winged helix DNA-binding protein n=1 Tax=Sphingomonas morindae TaxID=1541170 RepID=UPI003F5D55E4
MGQQRQDAPRGGSDAGTDSDVGVRRLALAEHVLATRRARQRFLPTDLFADPAWDMMLDLYVARARQVRVGVSSLCIASAVPQTTALRWIKALTERGLIERQHDPVDRRRIYVALSEQAVARMNGLFDTLPPIAG